MSAEPGPSPATPLLGKRGASEVSSHDPAGGIRRALRPEPTGFDGPESHRRLFWQALKVAQRVTTNKRQAYCRRVIRGDQVTIEMRPQARKDRASFGGLFICGRNGCPVCGPKIAAERAADLALAISLHYHAGGRVAMATWTMRHDATRRLSELLDGLSRAGAAVRENKTPKRLLAAHSVGQVGKLEVTVGPRHGWHPHKHELLFLRAGATDDQAREMDAARFAAWSASLERQGFGSADPRGHEFRALDLDQAHEKVAEYVAKSAGHELAAAGTKRGRGESRTPLELLLDFGELGLDSDRRLWVEHEQAMHGKRVLRWSPGLRARLIGDLPELSDQEAAESTDGAGRVIAAIGVETWRRVWRSRYPPSVLLAAAELYENDEDRSDAVARYLARHELGHLEAGISEPARRHGSLAAPAARAVRAP